MKKEFVETENAQRFRAALTKHDNAAADESNIIFVHGRAGDGKTRTLYNWASGVNAVMLTAHPGWTVRRMMVELADSLSIPARGEWEAAVAAQIAAEETPIIIDEAGFALRDNAACLERLRAITDKSATLLVAVVMERDMERLRQFDQLTSRATLCHFRASSLEDVRAACKQLAAVEIKPDLAERIHRDSGARMRLVIEAINACEQAAQAMGKASVNLADLAGYALCEDFNHALRHPRRAGRRAEAGAAA